MSRFMIAGTNSGCGKTTITCALLSAFRQRGFVTAPFKCGPDYIDPMFHTHITGQPSVNLDAFFLNETALKEVMSRRLSGSDIGLIEGVMGLYDGVGAGMAGSSFDIAVKTETPIILAVNAKGMALSLAALISGYKTFAERLKGQAGSDLIKGVILNQVGPGTVGYMKETIETMTGVKVLGCLERQAEAVLESRHLGLVTAEEVEDLDSKIELLGEAAQKTIDIDALLEIAASASPLAAVSGDGAASPEGVALAPEDRAAVLYGAAMQERRAPLYLAVAKDAAFCFYYEENLELLRQLGIEPVYFSPLCDEPLPRGVSGLYLGGGYPEIYAGQLSENEVAKASIWAAFESEMPTIAECGGFMYLHERLVTADGSVYPMAGVISGSASMTKKLGPFGYVDMKLKSDCLLGNAGDVLKGHEFHYSMSDNTGDDMCLLKQNGRSWTEGHCKSWLYAGYPHLYLPSFVKSALFFRDAMISYNKRD